MFSLRDAGGFVTKNTQDVFEGLPPATRRLMWACFLLAIILLIWLSSEVPQNRETERCSQLVWARLSSLPDDTIPYVRTAIENFQNHIWFQEFGWEKGTT